MEQHIHFCTTSDGVRIAYATVGEGPPLVKAANWLNHLEFDWQSPIWRHLLEEFARDHLLVRYDERGNGLSDWNVENLSFDEFVRDLESVVDAVGLSRFPLLGISQGGAVAVAYAVRHPERVSHLILYGAYARGWARRGSSEEIDRRKALLTLTKLGWGQDNPAYRQLWTTLYVPDAAPEQMQWFNDLQRVSASPENAVRLLNEVGKIDVLDLLPQVRVPTLVLHCRDEVVVPFEEGRLLAASIPGALFVPLEGRNHLLLESESAWTIFIAEVRRFLGTEKRAETNEQDSQSKSLGKAELSRRKLPDRYRIVSSLGAGGMGEVYLAHDARLDRKVAIKVLPPESTADEAARKRLIREAQAAAKLDHPNICAIHEVGDELDAGYIVMQYVEGETLAKLIQRKPLELRESLDIAAQVADAVAEAHSHGIIHRDIKPSNIMITARRQVKVMDFGLAKVIHPAMSLDSKAETESLLTEPGMIIGTVPYMSPEQVRGETLDSRTDIFSFGAVVYEMVAGRQPFAAESAAATLSAILTREAPPLARYAADVPEELQRIVRKCLEKDRERRYQMMRDVTVDLENVRRERETAQLSGSRAEQTTRTVAAARTDRLASRHGLFRHRFAAGVVVLALIAIAAIVYALVLRRSPAIIASEIKSLAVLPLENLSGDPTQEYFADGMTEALISNLAQIRALSRVISRTSVMRYKGSGKSLPEIAAELKVDAVIEGTVQRSGGRVRVTAKLIPAATDSPLWSREYNRDESDVLKLQSDIARAVADEIRIQVTPEERARLAAARNINPQAHEAYLLGRLHLRTNEEDLRQAIGQFERAIQLAPDYAAAYAGLSRAWMRRGRFGAKNIKEVLPLARDAAVKAVALDPQLAEAHVALSAVEGKDWAGAERELTRALELDSNSAEAHERYADLLMALERHDEAIREIQRAEQLDPLSSDIQSRYGRVLYRARKYEEAVPHLQRAIELDPNPGNSMPYWIGAELYAEMGRYDEAIASYKKAQSHGISALSISAGIAGVYALMGKPNEARRMLEELKATTDPASFSDIPVARAYAALGDKDKAFKVLFRLVEERESYATYIKADPPFDGLHADPRWKELLRRMNFPPE